MKRTEVGGFWLHLDSDVISDDENPAVDHRAAGGPTFAESERLMHPLMAGRRVVGMSVAIYNPNLDKDGRVGRSLALLVARVLSAKAGAEI